MKTLTVQPADDGKRLDRWMKTNVPGLSLGLTQKYLRLKRVKVDGKPASGEERLRAGACVNLYIEDEFFEPREKPDALLSRFRWKLTVVYEDENILLADKQPGLICHPDENEKVNTLLTHVRAYLYQKGFRGANGFQPVLVNRIDRFTGGLVICAKTEEAMHILNAKIRSHELTKLYLAAVHGAMRPADGTLDSCILKDAARSRVSVLHKEAPGAQRAVTHYRTLARENGLSLVECELVTGRTHQIRAQFADAGHPLLGDRQYGAAQDARVNGQALYAYGLRFAFETDAGILNDLNGRSFHVKRVPFAEELFPSFRYRP